MIGHIASLVSRARGDRADIQPVVTAVRGHLIEPAPTLPDDQQFVAPDVSDEADTAPTRSGRPPAQQPEPPGRAAKSPPPYAPARAPAEPQPAVPRAAPVRGETAPAARPGEPVADQPPPTEAAGLTRRRATSRSAAPTTPTSGAVERATAADQGRADTSASSTPSRPSERAESAPSTVPARTDSESAEPITSGRSGSSRTSSESRALTQRAPAAVTAPAQTSSSILSRRRGGRLEAMAARRAGTGEPPLGADAPPSVHIAIGRVEVRAIQPPPAPAPPRPPEPARPSQSLDDYLRERDRSVGA